MTDISNMSAINIDIFLIKLLIFVFRRFYYQPLFVKGARAPPPKEGAWTGHERAVEIEPMCFVLTMIITTDIIPSGFRKIYVDATFCIFPFKVTLCKRHAFPLKKNNVNVSYVKNIIVFLPENNTPYLPREILTFATRYKLYRKLRIRIPALREKVRSEHKFRHDPKRKRYSYILSR